MKGYDFTGQVRRVLEFAREEAERLNHEYVGTEHLLIGLLREEKGIAAQVLVNQGLTVDAVRDEVLSLAGNDSEATSRRFTFSTQVAAMFPKGLDALEAAPQHHKLLLENEHVRMLETRIPSGETTPLHTHRYPAAHHVTTWSHFVRRNEAGEVMLDTRETDFSRNEPRALWGTALTPHTVENVGNATLHIVSVELKSTLRHDM